VRQQSGLSRSRDLCGVQAEVVAYHVVPQRRIGFGQGGADHDLGIVDENVELPECEIAFCTTRQSGTSRPPDASIAAATVSAAE
jgi:hypothetical protein